MSSKVYVGSSAALALDRPGKQLKRRNSPPKGLDANANVALFDVSNKRFVKLKKREAEKLAEKLEDISIHDLPRWSSKTCIYVSEPMDKSQRYILATLHLRALGFNYNLLRWLGSPSELYIKGIPNSALDSVESLDTTYC